MSEPARKDIRRVTELPGEPTDAIQRLSVIDDALRDEVHRHLDTLYDFARRSGLSVALVITGNNADRSAPLSAVAVHGEYHVVARALENLIVEWLKTTSLSDDPTQRLPVSITRLMDLTVCIARGLKKGLQS